MENWEDRPRYPSPPGQPVDFGDWHKTACAHWAYCMDIDRVELGTRVDWRMEAGRSSIVGIYELIRCSDAQSLMAAPTLYSPRVGKRVVLYEMEKRFPGVPVFYVWHRDDMSAVLILPAHHFPPDGVDPIPSIPILLSEREFVKFLEGLPWWPHHFSECSKCGRRIRLGEQTSGETFSFETRVTHIACPERRA